MITYERLINEGFPARDAKEIIARMAYGETFDSAVQTVMCDMEHDVFGDSLF